MNFYLSPCFKTWMRNHRIWTAMQNTMLTISNTVPNLNKLDCKTPLIYLCLIPSLPVKGLPFKITFTTGREEQHCHGGMATDKLFLRVKCWPILGRYWKNNTFFFFFFHVRKGSSSRDFFLWRGFWNCILFWGNVEEIGELVLLFPLTGKSVIHPLTATSLHVWQSNQLSGAGKWWWATAVKFCNPEVPSCGRTTRLHDLHFIGRHVYV